MEELPRQKAIPGPQDFPARQSALHGRLSSAACLSQLLAESHPLTCALMRSEAELDSECCATSSRC